MMVFSQQTKPLSIFKILCEALKLPFKNLNVILPILIFSFLANSLLLIFADLSVNPLLADLTSKIKYIASLNPNSPEFAKIHDTITKEIKELFGIEALDLLISLVVSSFVTIAMFRALSMSCSNKLSDINENRWRGPIITEIYVMLLNWGYTFLLLAVFTICMYMVRGSTVFVISGVILLLLGQILYLYLLIVWSMGVVVSVMMEDGCYGWDAILKAGEVIKGRRGQGTMLMLIQLVLGGAFFMVYEIVSSHPPTSLIAQVGIAVVYATVSVVINVFDCAMIMVFYCDCKRSNGGKGMVLDSGGFMYSIVPTAALIEDQV